MKILMISIGPLSLDWVSGGATRVLRDLAISLGKRGHQVRVLCGRRRDSKNCMLGPGVSLLPVLAFREAFPDAYAIPVDQHDALLADTAGHVGWCDVVYVHDGGYLYTDLFAERPLVVSIRELMYSESLVGAFSFRRDVMVVNSDYTARCLMATIGRWREGLVERLRVIESGIDVELFTSTVPASPLNTLLNTSLLQPPVLLFPHRPENRKGLPYALAVLRAVKRRLRGRSPTLLMPFDGPDGRLIADKVDADLRDQVVLHPWIPHHLMPAYYSLGTATLCLGTFVEGFGPNVLLESVAAGVPVIQSIVGPARELDAPSLVHFVEPGDCEKTADLIVQIEKKSPVGEVADGSRWVACHSLERMVDAYESVFAQVRIENPLKIQCRRPSVKCFKLAPWCAWMSEGLYHDFRGVWWRGHGEDELRAATQKTQCLEESVWRGARIPEIQWQRLVKEGFLVADGK